MGIVLSVTDQDIRGLFRPWQIKICGYCLVYD